jgi:hypothetical protein
MRTVRIATVGENLQTLLRVDDDFEAFHAGFDNPNIEDCKHLSSSSAYETENGRRSNGSDHHQFASE